MSEFKPHVIGSIPEREPAEVIQVYLGERKNVPCTYIKNMPHGTLLNRLLKMESIEFETDAKYGFKAVPEGDNYHLAGAGTVALCWDGERLCYLWEDAKNRYGKSINKKHLEEQIASGGLPTDLEHRVR